MSDIPVAPQLPSPPNRIRKIEHNHAAIGQDKQHFTIRDMGEISDAHSYPAEYERAIGGAADVDALFEKPQMDKTLNPYNDKFGVCDMLQNVLNYCHELPNLNQREHMIIASLQPVIDKIRDQLAKAVEVSPVTQDPYELHKRRQNTSEARCLVQMATDNLNLFLNKQRLVSTRTHTMAERDEMLQIVARSRRYWSLE